MHQSDLTKVSTASGRQNILLVWLSSDTFYALIALLIVAYFSYGLFFVPAIYSDDWSQGFGKVLLDSAKWLDFTNRRPLLYAPFLLQHRVVGLNVTAWYIFLWLLYVGLAYGIYLISRRFSVLRTNNFGLVVALLFLVYPTNYTHMWLTMLHGYAAFGLTILYAFLLLKYAEGSSWIMVVLALVCLLLSLGLYEAQVGLATIWPLLLIFVFRKENLKRRFNLFVPALLVLGAFAIWRTWGYEAIGVNDNYLAQLDTTPTVLLSRLLLGYKINLIWGWTIGIQNWLTGLPNSKIAFLILIGVVVTVWLVNRGMFYFIDRQKDIVDGQSLSFSKRQSSARLYLLLSFLGFLLIMVGYFPVILVYLPSLSQKASRFNVYSTVGGALFVSSLLMIGSLYIGKNQRQVRALFLVSALPVLALGILTQASVQFSVKSAWQEQQSIWNQLFSIAPDFHDESFVLFIIPGYQDRVGYQSWKRTPLDASWEVRSGIRLLYDNLTLSADVIFPDVEKHVEPFLTEEGIYTQDNGVVTPYDRVIAFVYDNATGALHQIDVLSSDYIEGSRTPIKLCTDCVINGEELEVPLRKLVKSQQVK